MARLVRSQDAPPNWRCKKPIRGLTNLQINQYCLQTASLNLVLSYSGYYTGLSSRISGFDSPQDRQKFSECSAVWLAHLVWDQGVQGSNPCTPTKERSGCLRILWPAGWEVVWQLRVVVFKPKGRWQHESGTRRGVGGGCRSIPLERGHVYWYTIITTGVRRAFFSSCS